MSIQEPTTINLGYLPLLDSAPLIIAQEAGFFQEFGVNVRLHRENSWASIRDKLSLGMFDGAHLLAPMLLASHLTKTSSVITQTLTTSVSLGYSGNAFTVSHDLAEQINLKDAELESALVALNKLVSELDKKLIIGTVYPHSMHTFLIHILLKKADIPLDSVEIKVIPPVHMVDAMKDREVDLFCVGEPWNTAAQIQEAGEILCYGSELWETAPEKVLAVTNSFTEEQPGAYKAVIKAIIKSCQWLEEPDHIAQASIWISSERFLNCSSDLLIQAMLNQWHTQNRPNQKRKVFYSNYANAPWPAHAEWIQSALTQIEPFQSMETVIKPDITKVYQWDTYIDVLTELGLARPDKNKLIAKPGL